MYFKEFLVGGKRLPKLGKVILKLFDGWGFYRFLRLKEIECRGLVEV